MRAVTIAAASAAILGSTVSAGSHVQNMHKQLHARSGWNDWSSSPVAESKPADLTTKPAEPKPTSTKPTPTKPADLTKESTTESTWADWESSSVPADSTKKSSDPVEITSTKPAESTTTEHTWEDWSSTTSSPVEVTSTSSYDPSTVSWEDWSSSSSSDPVEITSTSSKPAEESHTWADWSESSSDPAVVTSTSTWADWSASSSDPAVETATSETWADWSSTVVKSGTTTTTIYLGKPTDPASTWADWSSSVPADLTATSTEPADTTSSPAPAWSSDGWFGPGWGASDGQCAIQVVTSYGSPVWSATPDASMPVLSVTVSATPADETASSTWADWSASSSDPAVETATSTWADWSASSSEPSVETTTSASGTWADWSSTAAASATPTSGSGGIGGSGNTWGMTYSPYTSEGGCKDAGTVENDLTVIAGKGFTTVRVYSTDCDTLVNVGTSARKHGLKLILGVFISNTGISGSKEQVWDIINWGQWDLVELIVIGNEAIFNGYCSASELAAYITESAGFFKKAGYTGSVTTTEPLAEWKKDGAALCSAIDVVAANLYAFFNPQTTADKAGDFIQAEIKELEWVCPGKDTYVMETGWPHAGNCNGAACPSPENQSTALKSIQSVTGSKVIFFSYEDEAWKSAGEFGVEQYWGCASVF